MISRILALLPVSRKGTIDRWYIIRSRWFSFGLKLHRIHTSDEPDVFHDHPWPGVSILLNGSYVEEHGTRELDMSLSTLRLAGFGEYPFSYDEKLHFRRRRVRFLNFIHAKRLHRVEIDKPVWTLFIHGPRTNENWGFYKRVGRRLRKASTTPWRGPDR